MILKVVSQRKEGNTWAQILMKGGKSAKQNRKDYTEDEAATKWYKIL